MASGTESERPSDEEVFAYFHDVHLDRDNLEHYRGLMMGRLLINRCTECGHWIYPHRPLCHQCFSWDVRPTEVSGEGRLYMYTFLHQARDPDHPLEQPAGFAAVELAEQPGLRYLSRVIGCPPEALYHDMPLRLSWIEEGARRWPVFAPDRG